MRMVLMFAVGTLAVLAGRAAHADAVTACTTNRMCYCINGGLQTAIDKNVALIRGRIAQQRASGKAIGYR